MVQRQKNSKILGLIVFLIITLAGLLYFNINSQKERVIDIPRYMVIGKENVFVVYEDKLSISFPFDIQIDDETTIEDLYKVGDYEGIKKGLNWMLPEKVEEYKVVKKGEIRLNVAYKYIVPVAVLEGKKYVLTSSLNSLYKEKYYKSTSLNAENVIIDVLNGNGKSGYAGKTGKKIETALSYKYNAANYERDSEYSYIINKDLSPSQVKELVMTLDEKYIKIKSKLELPTLANAVVILGKESNVETKIIIHADPEEGAKVKDILAKEKYYNLSTKKTTGSMTAIEYKSEDYYIAYKIAKKLNIKNLIEKNSVNNSEIHIYIKHQED